MVSFNKKKYHLQTILFARYQSFIKNSPQQNAVHMIHQMDHKLKNSAAENSHKRPRSELTFLSNYKKMFQCIFEFYY